MYYLTVVNILFYSIDFALIVIQHVQQWIPISSEDETVSYSIILPTKASKLLYFDYYYAFKLVKEGIAYSFYTVALAYIYEYVYRILFLELLLYVVKHC